MYPCVIIKLLRVSGVGVNAAMAAYQNALLSAMAAHTHTFPTNISGKFNCEQN